MDKAHLLAGAVDVPHGRIFGTQGGGDGGTQGGGGWWETRVKKPFITKFLH